MKQENRKRRKIIALIGTVVISLVIGIAVPGDSGPELKLRDLRFQIRGEKDPAVPLIIAAVDDTSFEMLNARWPWKRSLFAEAVEVLADDGAAVIGFDVMLSEEDYTPEGDEKLSAAFALHGRSIIPMKLVRQKAGRTVTVYTDLPLPLYRSSAYDRGFVNLFQDRDEEVRSLPLSFTVDGTVYPSFALAVIKGYLNRRGTGGGTEGEAAETTLIDYCGGPGTFPGISISDVLELNFPPGLFTDKIVLIGAGFAESHDHYATPFAGGNRERMYGVDVHAHAINTLYAGTAPKPLSPGWAVTFIAVLIGCAAAIGYCIRPGLGLAGTGGLLGLYFLSAVLVFNGTGVFIPLFRPLLVIAVSYLGSVIYRYFGEFREKKAVESIFSRYVSPRVVEKVLDQQESLTLGGEVREIVLFFSDIREFTHMSESLSPPVIVRLLNRYFERMGEIIYTYEGTLNKFIGDAVMAFYGAPVPQPDAPRRAVYAALDMREALTALNEEFREEGLPELSIGMGMHLGDVLVGNIGSSRQMEYTVIGDAVNVCSRIESLTKEFGHDILISDELYQKVRDIVTVETPRAVPVKGKSTLIQVHKVIDRK